MKIVRHGEVGLHCQWPSACPARILRGAVIAEVDNLFGASVHWHNHGDDGIPAARPAQTYYRITDGKPTVYAWGQDSHSRLTALAGRLHALRLPGGGVIAVDGCDLQITDTNVQVLGKTWRRYELVTPYYPSRVLYARRPRDYTSPERQAWIGASISASLCDWLRGAGIDLRVGPSVHTYVSQASLTDGLEVKWERPERGKVAIARGFRCRFVSNVQIPDGAGIGQHKSEGFGEVRCVR